MNNKVRKKPRLTAWHKFIAFTLCVFLLGACVGFACDAFSENAETSAALPYGTRDGKRITENGGVLFNYESSTFAPIDCALSTELQEFTYYLCEAYYIDFAFAMAVMFTESSFCADAVSASSDYGLMQINTCNHYELEEALGITDFSDPYQNIRAGLYILRRLFERYDDPARVCMAYNMGEYGAWVLWEKGVHETTYSNKVLTKADEYAAQIGGTGNV